MVMVIATAHPQDLYDDQPGGLDVIEVKFLSSNTTSFLQSMDQQVISSLKMLHTRALFIRSFKLTRDTLMTHREFWKDHFTNLNCLTLIDNG